MIKRKGQWTEVKTSFLYAAFLVFIYVIVFKMLMQCYSCKNDRINNTATLDVANDININGTIISGILKQINSVCSKHPLFFHGNDPNVNIRDVSWADVAETTRHLLPGGRFIPNCSNPDTVAIIIPYRNRDEHLRIFLQKMHPFLQAQNLQYSIYVIELEPELTFNRGLLLNIGYTEATKRGDYECFIFHDVDLIPERLFNKYSCQKYPTHMSSAVDKFNYTIPYGEIFGGVTSFRKEQFEKVNGYSNLYFGWGGEDDDIRERIVSSDMEPLRLPLEVGRYTMLQHKRDKHNDRNYFRHKLLEAAAKRISYDGINSLHYQTVKVQETSYFTKVTVRIFRDKYNEILHISCGK